MGISHRLLIVAAAITGLTSILAAPAAGRPAAGVAAGVTTAGRGSLWAATYHGPQSGDSRATAEVLSPGGSVLFVTGSTGGSSSGAPRRWATVAYNAATGTQQWVQTFQGTDTTQSGSAAAYSIAVSPAGPAVFITGQTSSNTTGAFSFMTIAYKPATGARLWWARYALPTTGTIGAVPAAIVASPDGSKVFVTGAAQNTTGALNFATVAYRA